MAMVIGVRFKKAGKVYYFDPCDIWPRPGSNVVVETARGVEFGEVVTGVEWLSRDAAQYLPFANDPKCHFTFTNAGFRDLFRLLHRISGKQWSNRVPKELPILILSGEEDPVGNYGKGVRQVYGWLKKSGIHALQLKLYPEARHELHNELNRDEFVEEVLAFLSCHSGIES